jgi:hypothetical protein
MDALDELLRRPTPSALVALDGAVLSLNAAMARVLGRSVEQCLGLASVICCPQAS